MSYKLPLAGLIAAPLLIVASATLADDIADFYKGKTINFIIGSATSGGYDTYGRLVVRSMGKHIAGKPEIVPRNMPGGSSRVAASSLYHVVSKDGLSVAMINQELPLAQVLGEKFQFDVSKFQWIGTPDTDNRAMVTWHSSGVKTIGDAKVKEATMGASGPIEASGYPEMLNTLVGTKFKSIKGYAGGGAINLAMERGEVDGRGDNAWESWKGDHGDWIRDGKIHVIVQVGLTKVPDLPDVPLLMDLATRPEDRAVLKLISTPTTVGHPIVAPPGVPVERIAALRAAFDATMTDPGFLADAEKQRRPIRPVSGEQLQKIVADMLATPPDVVARAIALTHHKELQ